jgi:hypothetical protein
MSLLPWGQPHKKPESREMKALSADQVIQHFLDYLRKNRANSAHVHRVAAWLGFLVKGIDRISDDWGFWHSRQFWFKVGSKCYKVRFRHNICFRGGIEIVEMRGNQDGAVVIQFRNPDDAEAFYNRPTLAPSALVAARDDRGPVLRLVSGNSAA